PLAATQYVRPEYSRANPGAPTEAIDAGKVAPERTMQAPAGSAVATHAVRAGNIWGFGRRQLVATVVGAIFCGVVYYGVAFLIHSLQSSLTPDYDYALSGLILVLPLFFGFAEGPWVGLFAAG